MINDKVNDGQPEWSLCAEFIESIRAADDIETIHRICSKLCCETGFDHFIYGAQFPVSLVRPQVVIISGYPVDWRAHYEAQAYMALDPTVTHCFRHTTPLVWGLPSRHAPEEEEQLTRFWHEAADHGLRSGVSFPIHAQGGEMGMLSLASSRSQAQCAPRIQRALALGQLLSNYIHETTRRVFDRDHLPIERDQLTARERECLLWAAEGKTASETAIILGISERTVVFHLQNVVQKLNVTNRSQAVARAIACGYINPSIQ